MKKRKATITFETERLLVITHSRYPRVRAWCEGCGQETDFIGVEEAAALSESTQRRIFNLAETGVIHLLETAEGRALFCAASLPHANTWTTITLEGDTK